MHIFISYAHADSDFAELLKNELEKESIVGWRDIDRLKAGDDWREGIDKAITESFACIVILSPDADESKYVTYEWSFAFGLGKKIIPILYRSCEKLHPRLEGWQYEDFRHNKNRPWTSLINRVNEIKTDNYRKQPLVETAQDRHVYDAISALESWKPDERQEAAKVLGDIGNSLVIPSLMNVMNDKYLNVKIAAIQSLGKIGDKTTILDLMQHLNDSEPQVRIAIANLIAKHQYTDATSEILNLLSKENNAKVRFAYVETISLIANEESILDPIHDALLRDSEITVREAIAKALGKIRAQKSIPFLFQALNDTAIIRDTSKLAILCYSFEYIYDYLCSALQDVSFNVTISAIRMSGEFGESLMTKHLLEIFDANDEGSRVDIAKALHKINDIHSFDKVLEVYREYLIKHFEYDNSSDEFVQICEKMIASLATLENIQKLLYMLFSNHWEVRQAVARLLGDVNFLSKTIGLPELLMVAVRDSDDDVIEAAYASLDKHLLNYSIKEIVNDLSDDDTSIQSVAIEIVAEYYGFRGLLAILAIGQSPFWTIVEKLVSIYEPSNNISLQRAIDDEYMRVRACVAEVYRNIGNQDDCQFLEKLVKDDTAFVRGLAIRAAGENKCESLKELILSILINKDVDTIYGNSNVRVCDYAAIALGEMNDRRAIDSLIDSLKYVEGTQVDVIFELISDLQNVELSTLLKELFKHEIWQIRMESVMKAGRDTGSDLLDELIELAKIELDPDVLRRTIDILGETRNRKAIDVLVSKLDDFTVAPVIGGVIAEHAVVSLEKIGTDLALSIVTEWKAENKDNEPSQTSNNPQDLDDIPF